MKPITILGIVLSLSISANIWFTLPEQTQEDIKYRLTHSYDQYRLWKDYGQEIPYGIEDWESFRKDYPDCAIAIQTDMAMKAITGTKELNLDDFNFNTE